MTIIRASSTSLHSWKIYYLRENLRDKNRESRENRTPITIKHHNNILLHQGRKCVMAFKDAVCYYPAPRGTGTGHAGKAAARFSGGRLFLAKITRSRIKFTSGQIPREGGNRHRHRDVRPGMESWRVVTLEDQIKD